MSQELKSTKLLRTGLKLKKKQIPLIPSIIQKFLRLYYGFEVIISQDMSLGENVKFAHNGLGTVINQKVKIGNNVKIYQNVTVGKNKRVVNGELLKDGAPTIEDGVVIFSGAVVVGDIIIGKNSVIGANTVVTTSIPANSIVYPNKLYIGEKDESIEY
ncbi:serine O-acetyltransferase [Enterococcus avium]|uniref:serine O-acetyltransferase n=1 Tax=Enterococcus avium TaxID=33945 RepID=UPI0035CC1848